MNSYDIFYFKNSSQYTILEIRETGSHLFDHKRNSQRVDAKWSNSLFSNSKLL